MEFSLPGSSVHGVLQTRILEWVAIPLFRESSQPRDQTQVSFIAGRFIIIWATREAPVLYIKYSLLIHFKTEYLYLLISSSILQTPKIPSPLATTIYSLQYEFVFIFILFYFLDSTFKWNHTVFVFVSLTYFTQPDTVKFYQCCCKWQGFFLFFYVWIVPHCVYLTSSLSICGNLSGFHILTVVISAAMNIGTHIYFWISVFVFFLVNTQKWHLINHMTVLFLILWGNSILLSLAIAPVYIIIKCAQGFSFFYHLIKVCYFLSFDNCLSEVGDDFSLWFWSAFPWWWMMLNIFSCACWPSKHLFWIEIREHDTSSLVLSQDCFHY